MDHKLDFPRLLLAFEVLAVGNDHIATATGGGFAVHKATDVIVTGQEHSDSGFMASSFVSDELDTKLNLGFYPVVIANDA